MTKVFTKAEQVNQLAKAIRYYDEHEPLAYRLEAVREAAKRFYVSPNLLRLALRLRREKGK